MKAFMKTTFATLLVCALISIGAYAGDKGKSEKKDGDVPGRYDGKWHAR